MLFGYKINNYTYKIYKGWIMPQYKVEFDKIKTVEPMQGIHCQIYKNDKRQLRLVTYTKEMPPHWCNKDHYGYILDGEMEIEFLNQKIIFKKGDGVFIQNGDEHRHKAKVVSEPVRVIFVEDV